VPTILERRTRGGPKTLVATLRAQADRMLAHLGLEAAELSVTLVSDEAIQELNRTHRGMDKPTDVLAFPLGEAPAPDLPHLLGDVVISLPTAARQARSRKRPLLPEARFLLAHGLLHLIGYDHATRAQKRRMDAATRRLVRVATSPAVVRSKASPDQPDKARGRPKIGQKAPRTRRSR
jgi:probable rRNA maturation factor